jgi:uridine kinase
MLRICLSFLVLAQSLSAVIIVGIAGGTGSGKTTLAERIQQAFPHDSVLISQDSYYKDQSHLPFEERCKTNFDHPNSLDFALFAQNIRDLKDGKTIAQPIYSFHTHNRESGQKKIDSQRIVIVEGILLFAVPEIRELCDMKIFVDTDDDIRLLRRIERDIKERSRDLVSVKEQYLATVKPMHDLFVEPSKEFADLIIPRGGHNAVALEMILSQLKESF